MCMSIKLFQAFSQASKDLYGRYTLMEEIKIKVKFIHQHNGGIAVLY